MRIQDIQRLEEFVRAEEELLNKIINQFQDESNYTGNKSVDWADELDSIASELWKTKQRLNKFRYAVSQVLRNV
jgi:hypothetical protein